MADVDWEPLDFGFQLRKAVQGLQGLPSGPITIPGGRGFPPVGEAFMINEEGEMTVALRLAVASESRCKPPMPVPTRTVTDV